MDWSDDMDAAPKDGQSFIAAVPPQTGDEDDGWWCGLVHWIVGGHPVEKGGYFGTGDLRHWVDLYAAAPSHWMPLPTPPETDNG